MDKPDIIKSLNFGSRVAEDEMEELKQYFVQTDDWKRFISGNIDIVYGYKGSGKSAIYLLLLQNRETLAAKNIVVLHAENLRGKTAFSQIEADPPTTEAEFNILWKLYFVTLIANHLAHCGIKADFLRELRLANLIQSKIELTDIFYSVAGIVKRFRNPEAFETGTSFDSTTGEQRLFARLVLDSRSEKISPSAFHGYLEEIERICSQEKLTFWVALDRLDVAFAENAELETNAIRALFRVYLDLAAFPHIKLKLFVRTDIWQRITNMGFREGSHITRCFTINWNKEDIVSLILNRALKSDAVRSYFSSGFNLDSPPPRNNGYDCFHKCFRRE